MVAGARAFKGEYQQALAYEIVSQEPEPLTGVRSGVPMELEFIVGKCLAKDAADRYQHANEIAVDLRTLSEKLKSGRSTIVTRAGELSTSVERTRIDAPVLPEQPSAREGGGTQRERLAWAAAVAVLAVVATALAITHFGQSAPELETARFLIEPPDGVRFGLHAAEISPDGRQLAFIGVSGGGAPQLWVRSLASVEARPLRGTEGAALPFWSPDSRFLGFFADGKLKKVDIAGGPAQTLCDAASGIGGTWAQGPTEAASSCSRRQPWAVLSASRMPEESRPLLPSWTNRAERTPIAFLTSCRTAATFSTRGEAGVSMASMPAALMAGALKGWNRESRFCALTRRCATRPRRPGDPMGICCSR